MLYWLFMGAIGMGAVALTVVAAQGWKGDRFLCDDCRFNAPESCLKSERPTAMSCMAYKTSSLVK